MRLLPVLALAAFLLRPALGGGEKLVSLRMDNVLVTGDDVYMACSVVLPREAAHIGARQELNLRALLLC